MPKTTDLTQDLPEPFLRGRRNVVLMSVALFAVSLYGDAECQTISLLGFSVKLSLLEVLGWGLFFLAYFSWRAWQRLDLELLLITPEMQKLVYQAFLKSGFGIPPNNLTLEDPILAWSKDYKGKLQYMVKAKGERQWEPVFLNRHESPNIQQKTERLIQNLGIRVDAKKILPLITEKGETANATNPVLLSPELFQILPKDYLKQFLKYPYLSDYLLPFLLAWVAFGMTLGRMLCLTFPVGGLFPWVFGSLFVVTSVIVLDLFRIKLKPGLALGQGQPI